MEIIGQDKNRKLDLLLVNPPTLDLISQKSEKGLREIPSYNLAFLATLTKKRGFNVAVLDAEAQKSGSLEEIAKRINDVGPRYVGFTVNTPTYHIVRDISRGISSQIPIIFGGIHPTALPTQTLEGFAEFNTYAIVIGPGEEVLPNLLEGLDREKIPNIIFSKKDQTIQTPFEAVKKFDLDPLLDRSFLINDPFVTEKGKTSFLLSSRGCYGNCSFCSIKTIWKQKLDFRAFEGLVDEMGLLNEQDVNEFRFLDDLFIVSPKRSNQFYDLLSARGLLGNFSLYSNSRVDIVNKFSPKDLEKLQKMGFKKIGLGIESGSNEVLERAQKGITGEEAFEAVRKLKENGLDSHCFFMLGFPYETEADMEKTMELAYTLKREFGAKCVVSPYKLYPGTKDFSDMIGNPSRQEVDSLSRFRTARLANVNDDPETKEMLVGRERFTVLHDENYFSPHQITTPKLERKIREFIMQQQ
jgi:anaerobic magnesium-protoporphyrin IX monomethyl ester cyclase